MLALVRLVDECVFPGERPDGRLSMLYARFGTPDDERRPCMPLLPKKGLDNMVCLGSSGMADWISCGYSVEQ